MAGRGFVLVVLCFILMSYAAYDYVLLPALPANKTITPGAAATATTKNIATPVVAAATATTKNIATPVVAAATATTTKIVAPAAAARVKLPNYGDIVNGVVSTQEAAFITEYAKVCERHDITFLLGMNASPYIWEHFAPFFHILPKNRTQYVQDQGASGFHWRAIKDAPKFGIPKSSIPGISTGRIPKILKDDVKKIFVSMFGGKYNASGRVPYVTHGLDEDHVYTTARAKPPHTKYVPKYVPMGMPQTVIFSRYIRRQLGVDVWSAFSLDKTKPLLVYFATMGGRSFLRRGEGLTGVLKALQQLTSDYNVVVRPHPITKINEREISRQAPGVKVDLARNGVRLDSWQKEASVVILEAGSGSGTTSSLYMNACQIIMRQEWQRPMYNLNIDHTINGDRAEQIWESQPSRFDSKTNKLVSAVKRCSTRDEATIKANEEARRKYARRIFGPINGYEEYRVAVRWLKYQLKARPELKDDIRMLAKLADELGKFDPIPYPHN